MRKKWFLAGLLLPLVFMLSACDVSQMSTLPDLSKPYVGIYECERAMLGGEDMTEKFDYIRLELSYGGEFELTYRAQDGNEGGFSGTYEASAEKGEITLNAQSGILRKSFTFPMENGSILIDLPFGGKLLHAEFRLP